MKKTVIIIVIVLIVVFAGAETYLQSDAFSTMIRPFVLGPLKELVGEDAKIGLIKAHFFPPSLEVRDISIPDAGGKEAVAIRRIKAYINPLPLFLKKIRLPSITIFEPRIYAERAKDGTFNLTPIIDRMRTHTVRKESEGGASGYSLLLRNLSLNKGRMEYKDGMTSAQFSLSDLNVTVRVYLSQDRFTTSIKSSRIRISTPAYPELLGKFKASVEYDQGRARLESVELSTSDAMITLSGEAGLLPESRLDLKITGRSGPEVIGRYLDFLKPARKQKASRFEVHALVRGKVSGPVIEGSLKMSDVPFKEYLLQNGVLSFSFRDGKFAAAGKQWKLAKGDKKFIIDSIDAEIGAGSGGPYMRRLDLIAGDMALHGDGRADATAGFDARLTASSGKGKTISFLTGLPLEGPMNMDGRLSGALVTPRFDGAFSAGPMTVRGILFSAAAGRIEYENKKIVLSSVEIAEQASRYIFNGSMDLSGKEPVYAARLRVLRSNAVNIVALFYKQLPLKLLAVGELNFQGTARNYSGNGYLKLDAGSAYGESFVRGEITAVLTTGRIAFTQVVLNKERGVVKAAGWIGFHDGTYSADIEGRGIDLSAIDRLNAQPITGVGKLDIHSSGSFSRPQVKASLDVDALSYQKVAVGGMHAEAQVREGALLLKAGLTGDRANVSARWTLAKPYPWTADVKIRSEAFDPFIILESKGLSDRVKMVAEGAVTARGRGLDLSTLSGEAIFKRLSLTIGDYQIDNDSDAKLAVEGGKVSVRALNFVGTGTRFGITGWVRPMAEMDTILKGTINLSLLKLLYREVEHAAGVAEVKVEIRDTWKNPDVTGELLLRNGDVKIKDIPQRFSALNSKIVFERGRVVTDNLSGEMGGGTLRASGWAQLSGVKLQEFSTKTSVENVTVRYPEGLVSTLSGELNYDGDASGQSLAGDITIRRSRYDKRVEWKSMLVDISRSLYQKKKTEVGWIGDTQINVRFHGANNIMLENNLAKMPLDVDVFLRGTVNHPQLLGRIEAPKGIVYFRKNEFKILRASVDFVDPNRVNPILDVQAETQVREYRIQLSVTGTADHAVVTFVSEPSLVDSDILAMLAIGKTGSELKGKESGVGVGEATSFATGQFQDVIERNARRFTGLDRFQVDPYVNKSDTSVPRVTVGKELVKNRLYVTYSSNVGASAPEQLFRIEYLLTRHFSVVGGQDETGNTGADIKYRFEFR